MNSDTLRGFIWKNNFMSKVENTVKMFAVIWKMFVIPLMASLHIRELKMMMLLFSLLVFSRELMENGWLYMDKEAPVEVPLILHLSS